MANKIANCSYFIKRLRDCGYVVDRLFDRYADGDARSWSIILDPAGASVWITYYSTPEEDSFELYDGDQFIPRNLKISTSSIEVIVEYLVKFGINNKASSYHGA